MKYIKQNTRVMVSVECFLIKTNAKFKEKTS